MTFIALSIAAKIRLAQAAVVQVKRVNIDVRFEGHKKQKPLDFSGGLAPLARRLGGDMQ